MNSREFVLSMIKVVKYIYFQGSEMAQFSNGPLPFTWYTNGNDDTTKSAILSKKNTVAGYNSRYWLSTASSNLGNCSVSCREKVLTYSSQGRPLRATTVQGRKLIVARGVAP